MLDAGALSAARTAGEPGCIAQRRAAEGGEEISALVGEEGCWKHSV